MDEPRRVAERSSDFDELPLSVVMKIDQLADEYELAWQAGSAGDFDRFVCQLTGAGEAAQAVLVAHLRQLRCDLESADNAGNATEQARDGETPPAGGSMPPRDVFPFHEAVQIGDYRLIEQLGAGGMGVVYKALHLRLDCFVAIKFPHLVATLDRAATARFLREARLVGRLKHPHIVRALDAGDSPYGPYLVTEFIEGETVDVRVRREGALPFDMALTLAEQAADALAYAHSQGIIHRDVKPSNMLLDADGTLRVVDFGLAKMQLGEEPSEQSLSATDCTQIGTFLGTVGFAAPEQLHANELVDHRADIYALGCVVYYMLAGKPPHSGTLADRLLTQRATSTTSIPLPSCSMSAGFEKMWPRMVANARHRRFESMSNARQAIRKALDDWHEGRRQSAPSRRALLLLPVILVLGILIAWGVFGTRSENTPTRFVPSGPPPPRAIAPFTPDEASAQQQRWADYLGMPVRVVNSVAMPLVLIPAGEFMMGLSDAPLPEPLPESGDWRYKEPDVVRQESLPRHRVVLTKAIYFGQTEVTVGQFRQFVDATKYVTDAERSAGWGKEDTGWLHRKGYSWKNTGQWISSDEHPVMNVTWNDATAFCQWLTEYDPLGDYRLPTEAEWEYACRAGSTTVYYFGDDGEQFPEHAWCKLNFKGQFHPVGLKTANPFGLHDMYGNRQEWCRDVFAPDFYGRSPSHDPICHTGGEERVMRGGAHSDLPSFCTSARRWSQAADSVGAAGIRVVCMPK